MVCLTDKIGALAKPYNFHLYSVASITNASGNVVERYSYDAYGKMYVRDASGALKSTQVPMQPYGFTGRRYDNESGLWYFRARYFDDQLGRFLARDPLGYVDGMSVYSGYFVPGGVDPSGRAECKDGECSVYAASYYVRGIRWELQTGNGPRDVDIGGLQDNGALKKLSEHASKFLKKVGSALGHTAKSYAVNAFPTANLIGSVIYGMKIYIDISGKYEFKYCCDGEWTWTEIEDYMNAKEIFVSEFTFGADGHTILADVDWAPIANKANEAAREAMKKLKHMDVWFRKVVNTIITTKHKEYCQKVVQWTATPPYLDEVMQMVASK